MPESFRFVVKAPAAVSDAVLRDERGRATQPNPLFLAPERACREFAEPALSGLGPRLGALVFQLSPLPTQWLADLPGLFERMSAMLRALPSLAEAAPDAVVAVQVRDAALLTPHFAALLREAGATYCLGLHARMPPIEDQLPMLRALWPGPLVCRWNLHRRHGAYGYEKARQLYEPYTQIADADLQTRQLLARDVVGGAGAQGRLHGLALKSAGEGERWQRQRARSQNGLNRVEAESRGLLPNNRRIDLSGQHLIELGARRGRVQHGVKFRAHERRANQH